MKQTLRVVQHLVTVYSLLSFLQELSYDVFRTWTPLSGTINSAIDRLKSAALERIFFFE